MNKENELIIKQLNMFGKIPEIFELLEMIEQLQSQVEKLVQENNDLENLYILARDNLSKSLLENADLKERIGYLERSNNRKEETIIELRMEQELDKYKDIIDKAIEKIQLLIDIGFDYDGYRQADSLMTLIDELVSYAKESRDILRSKE